MTKQKTKTLSVCQKLRTTNTFSQKHQKLKYGNQNKLSKHPPIQFCPTFQNSHYSTLHLPRKLQKAYMFPSDNGQCEEILIAAELYIQWRMQISLLLIAILPVFIFCLFHNYSRSPKWLTLLSDLCKFSSTFQMKYEVLG